MKKPTPKKKQCKSSSSRRYHVFENNTQLKLMGKVNFLKKLKKLGKLTPAAASSEAKVTKIKA